MTVPATYPLRRDSHNKVIAGVCAGIARRYGLSRNGLRLAFVLSCVLPGPQFVAYLLLWVLIPADRGRANLQERQVTSCCRAAARGRPAGHRPGRQPRR
jgi:phage shock protein PspC (stress-responsive transcriptional regulator)